MYNLFIDDERDPHHVTWLPDVNIYADGDWLIARDWPEVCEIIITLGLPTVISFDHDLGDNKSTGYDIAKKISDFIMNGTLQIPENFVYYVHSKNPVGKQNIDCYMKNFLQHMEK
jgi:hypothetical protein